MASAYQIEPIATVDNFDEKAYLRANPDVAKAVAGGQMKSGKEHFNHFGKNEGRRMNFAASDIIQEPKIRKLQKIKKLLRGDMQMHQTNRYYDFLTDELRSKFNIIDTDAVSSNGYDENVVKLIEKYSEGVILDCGAGKRPVYYDNVINFEIADFETTDVRGVGEVLPFVDGCFDAVISIAVLEHVKDPFQCAREITRVLKPGGQLYCCVPFLQPMHGYPHHYYNMTNQGLRNLFDATLVVDNLVVEDSVLPIWSLTWILKSWAAGLTGSAHRDFMEMRVQDLMESTDRYINMPFVRQLSVDKNFELASATILFAHKSAT
jgi:SAM-dependent methyltransferase